MWLAPLIFGAAVLYASVGHGGASAYLALMALAGVDPEVMRPGALVLNILVAGVGTVRYARAGLVSWSTVALFAAASVPLAFVGGILSIPAAAYRRVVGVVLLVGAFRLTLPERGWEAAAARRPPAWLAPPLGAAIGLLAGLTGVGGGIFLSPLLVFTGWAGLREQAGISAVFILVNSTAGLAGVLTHVGTLPASIAWWGAAAVAGGLIGSHLGARRFSIVTLRRLLGLVLVIAALKLLLT